MTANETFRKMYSGNIGPSNAASNSAARFSELRDRGVIYEVRETKCKVTGMNVILWDVTPYIPVEKKKPKAEHCPSCGQKIKRRNTSK